MAMAEFGRTALRAPIGRALVAAACMACAAWPAQALCSDGGAEGSSFSVVVSGEGISVDTDDMFGFAEMLPGESRTGSVVISNSTKEPCCVRLDSAEPELSVGSSEFLAAASLELTSSGETLSEGRLSEIGDADYEFELDAGETKEVAYKAAVSQDAGLEVASSAAQIRWTWSSAPVKEAALAKTGDPLAAAAGLGAATALLSAALAAASALMSRRRRKEDANAIRY